MSDNGMTLINNERARQIIEEGYSHEHDAGHTDELVRAALAYGFQTLGEEEGGMEIWPWDQDAWKPTTELRNLVKAGALIAAAIDTMLFAAGEL